MTSAPDPLTSRRWKACRVGSRLTYPRQPTSRPLWRAGATATNISCIRGSSVPRKTFTKRDNKTACRTRLGPIKGLIEPTPGNVIDLRRVEARIVELCERFDVREIAFDPWHAQVIMSNLIEAGLPAVAMRQGVITMAPAVKALEKEIISGHLHHGGHPILRWNFANVSVEQDKAGNKTFHKGNSKARIDGAQACAMAVGRASLGGGEDNSLYSDPEAANLFLW